jgi:hypothetical protein
VQDHIEQRFMNPDATVVFDKAEVAKAVHEEADAGPSGAEHFRQGFLGDRWNQRFRFSRLVRPRLSTCSVLIVYCRVPQVSPWPASPPKSEVCS